MTRQQWYGAAAFGGVLMGLASMFASMPNTSGPTRAPVVATPTPAQAPVAEAPAPSNVKPKRSPTGERPPGEPLRADVMGVRQLFSARVQDVAVCIVSSGPPLEPDETHIMMRVHLTTSDTEPPVGRIDFIETLNDEENRYAAYLDCVEETLADAVFDVPDGGQRTVNWTVRR
jgi:hypothetical protein